MSFEKSWESFFGVSLWNSLNVIGDLSAKLFGSCQGVKCSL